MVEKLEIISSDPFVERVNILIVFCDEQEPSNLLKKIKSTYQLTQEVGVYKFFAASDTKYFITVQIDINLNSSEYEKLFQFFIDTISKNYGNKICVALPECDNFQSITSGFFNAFKSFLNTDLQIILYVEIYCSNIVKPMIEALHLSLAKKKLIKDYLNKFLACTECSKFCYLPYKKVCCKKIICSRCRYRDKTRCSTCYVSLSGSAIYEEMEEICKQAPYLCKCGETLPFIEVASHIQNCFASEVECRICNEMTKFSNFIAHMRMCHMDRLKKDIESII